MNADQIIEGLDPRPGVANPRGQMVGCIVGKADRQDCSAQIAGLQSARIVLNEDLPGLGNGPRRQAGLTLDGRAGFQGTGQQGEGGQGKCEAQSG
ncbi:hypothetical protein SDC9_141939 [bioreactor metagenome]|uniref:Uncharacterized protein n=1 Tax=bioreactor metagenome TaxID=1076179 RepID=A0A645DZR2_9ZZZZ